MKYATMMFIVLDAILIDTRKTITDIAVIYENNDTKLTIKFTDEGYDVCPFSINDGSILVKNSSVFYKIIAKSFEIELGKMEDIIILNESLETRAYKTMVYNTLNGIECYKTFTKSAVKVVLDNQLSNIIGTKLYSPVRLVLGEYKAHTLYNHDIFEIYTNNNKVMVMLDNKWSVPFDDGYEQLRLIYAKYNSEYFNIKFEDVEYIDVASNNHWHDIQPLPMDKLNKTILDTIDGDEDKKLVYANCYYMTDYSDYYKMMMISSLLNNDIDTVYKLICKFNQEMKSLP